MSQSVEEILEENEGLKSQNLNFPHNFFNGAHPLLHHHLTIQTIFLVLRHTGTFV